MEQNTNIETKLKELLHEIDDEIDTAAITPESRLKEDIGLGSVALLYMAVSIENEFGVDLSGVDMKQVQTVQDILEVIERLR